MKRIYLVIAVVAALFTEASAQNIDLAAFLDIGEPADSAAGQTICANKFFTPNATAGDSIHGRWGFFFQGPDQLLVGEKVNYRTSFHHYLTQEECDAQVPPVPFADRYAWYLPYPVTQDNIDNEGIYYSYDSLGGIGMLLDWEKYQLYGIDSAKSITVGPPHEEFIDGKAYGFFARTWGIGADAESIVSTDENMDNNWAVVKIIWNSNCTETGIANVIAPLKKVDITVFPNPAVNEISLNYTFASNTNVTVYIRDVAGRIVSTKNFGHVLIGERKFKLDVANIPAGIYSLEMNAGDFRGIAKFAINR